MLATTAIGRGHGAIIDQAGLLMRSASASAFCARPMIHIEITHSFEPVPVHCNGDRFTYGISAEQRDNSFSTPVSDGEKRLLAPGLLGHNVPPELCWWTNKSDQRRETVAPDGFDQRSRNMRVSWSVTGLKR